MSASEASTSPLRAAIREPKTALELLDREEAWAIHSIATSLEGLGEDVSEALDLRARIRRNPFVSIGLGAALGFVGAPVLGRALQGLLKVAPQLHASASRSVYRLPGWVLASMRADRAWL